MSKKRKKKSHNTLKFVLIVFAALSVLCLCIVVALQALQGGHIDPLTATTVGPTQPIVSVETTPSATEEPSASVPESSLPATIEPSVPATEEPTTPEPTTTEYIPPTTECLPEMTPTMAVPADAPQRLNPYYFLVGNAAYDVFYYGNGSADNYINVVNTCAENLKGKANVYTLMVPNASGTILSADQQAVLGSYNMTNAMTYFASRLSPNVHYVDVYNSLLAHNREYIFFRTDHHWTQLGAYYAYRTFAEAIGDHPLELNAFARVEYPGFLGSIYFNTGKPVQLGNTPDTVIAYIPPDVNAIRYMHADGQWFSTGLINDSSSYEASGKYFTFGAGDQPFEIIDNPNQTNGRSCVIFKDSYGNPFVPFLAHHYQTVYICDPRYYDALHLYSFVQEKGVNDVLFLNSMEFLNQSFASQLAANF